MKNEPCIKLGMRIRPKISEKPDESRNSRLPSATLFTARVSHRLIVRLPVEPKPKVRTISVLGLRHLRMLHRNTCWPPTSHTSGRTWPKPEDQEALRGTSTRTKVPDTTTETPTSGQSVPTADNACRGLLDGGQREGHSSSRV